MTAHEIIDAMYASIPLVFGHRGAMDYAPMNTIPAFEIAVEQGVHGVELDVHLSKDGHVMVIHDFVLDYTTSGNGPVTEKTRGELKSLDAGSWYSEQYSGVQIPTLDEVLEAVGRQVFVNVEIKTDSPETNGIEEAVVACIKRHSMEQRVLLSSFNPATLVRFRSLMPLIPVGYLYAGDVDTIPEDAVYEAFHPHHMLITPRLLEQVKSHNQLLNVWTVQDADRVVALRDMGVHGLIVDDPVMALNALSL